MQDLLLHQPAQAEDADCCRFQKQGLLTPLAVTGLPYLFQEQEGRKPVLGQGRDN